MINADHCNIQGLTLTKSSGTANAIGIKIISSHNTISNMTISNVSEGFFLDKNSENNTISWNNISNNNYGIYTDSSFNNNFSNNYLSSNRLYGIFLHSSSDNNVVSGNCISFNDYGIQIKGSKNNKILNNSIINNRIGLYCCCGGYFNNIILNTFKNNTEFNAAESSGLQNENYWSTDYPSYAGNYWDDYYGVDENDNGFGDTPYDIPSNSNKDNYPLMNPIDTINNTMCIIKNSYE